MVCDSECRSVSRRERTEAGHDLREQVRGRRLVLPIRNETMDKNVNKHAATELVELVM